jgi:hypothetical protein
MKNDLVTKSLLAIIAVALSTIAIRPYVAPDSAHAENAAPYPVFIEPGVVMLKCRTAANSSMGEWWWTCERERYGASRQ